MSRRCPNYNSTGRQSAQRQLRPPSNVCPPARPSGLRPPTQVCPQGPSRPSGLRPPTQICPPGPGRPSGLRPPSQLCPPGSGRTSGLRPPTQICPPGAGRSSGLRPPTQICPPGSGRPSGLRTPTQSNPQRFGRQLFQVQVKSSENSPRRKSPLISSACQETGDTEDARENHAEECSMVAQQQSPCSPRRMRSKSPSHRSPQRLDCEAFEDEEILNLDHLEMENYRPISLMEQVQMEVPLQVRASPSRITLRMENKKVIKDSYPSASNERSCTHESFSPNEEICEEAEEEQRRFIPEFEYETPPRLKRPPVSHSKKSPFSQLPRQYSRDGIMDECVELYNSPSPEKPLLSPRGAESRRQERECHERDLFNEAGEILDEEQLDYEEIMDPDEQSAYDFISEMRQHPSRNLIRHGVPLEEKRRANIERRQTARFPRTHRRIRGKTTRRCYGQRPNFEPVKEYYEGPTEPVYQSPRRLVPPVYPSIITPPSAEKNVDLLPEVINIRISSNKKTPEYKRKPLDRRNLRPRKLLFDEEDFSPPPRPVSPCGRSSPARDSEFELTHSAATQEKVQRLEEQFPYCPTKMARHATEAYHNRPRPTDLITFKLGEYDFHISSPKPSIMDEDIPQQGLPEALIPYDFGWRTPPHLRTKKPSPPPKKPTVIKIMPSKYVNILQHEEFPYEHMPPNVTGWEFPYLATQAPQFIDRLGTEGDRLVSPPKRSPHNYLEENYGEDINLDCETLDMDEACDLLDECNNRSPEFKTLHTVDASRRAGHKSPVKSPQECLQPITIRIENGNVTVDSPQRSPRQVCPPKSPDLDEFEALERACEEREMVQETPCRRIPPPTNIPRPGSFKTPTGIPKPKGIPCPGKYGSSKAPRCLQAPSSRYAGTSNATKTPCKSLSASKCRKPPMGAKCKTPQPKKQPGRKGLKMEKRSPEQNINEVPEMEVTVSVATFESQSEEAVAAPPVPCEPRKRTPPRVSPRRLHLQRQLFDTYDQLDDLGCQTAAEKYHQADTSPLSQPLNLYQFREQVRRQKNKRPFRKKGYVLNVQKMRNDPIYEQDCSEPDDYDD